MRRILLLLIVVVSSLARAGSNDVLVIHSYHQGFLWTDKFQAGLEVSLGKGMYPMRVSFLDSKRYQTPDYMEHLRELYRTVLISDSFRAIIVSDNNALTLMNSLADYVGDTPVIFGGVNNYHPGLHNNLSRVTGVKEEVDLAGNFELIRKLQPNLKTVQVVIDDSVTGKANQAQLERYFQVYPASREWVKLVSPTNFDDLLQTVANLPPDNAVFFWLYYRSQKGDYRNVPIWRELSEQSSVPVYSPNVALLEYGVVGGVMVDGFEQGSSAGELLKKALRYPNEPLPAVQDSPNRLMFDFHALSKWSLNVEQVDSSTFLNHPPSYWEEHADELRVLALTVLLFAPIIILLLSNLSRIRKSERKLTQSQALFEAVFDQSYQLIGILDKEGRLISSNQKLQELFANQNLDLDRPLWQFKGWDSGSAQEFSKVFGAISNAGLIRFEAEITHSSYGPCLLEISLKVMPANVSSDVQYLFEARDITTRKLTEGKLMEREVSFRLLYEQQPVMLLTLDNRSRIQAVNQFTADLLGYGKMDLLGHKVSNFYLNERSFVPQQVLLQPQRDFNQVWRRDVEYRSEDGKVVWIRENIRPIAETKQLLIVGEDITEAKQLAKQLEYQAQHDLLTGDYNRNQFECDLEQSLTEVQSHFRTHAMLYLDLDQFKVINDTAGHEAGDEAIKHTSYLLAGILPFNATLARMGGDEFAILLRDCNEVQALELAKQIIRGINNSKFLWKDLHLNLSVSIGIRLIDHTATTPQMVHAQADTACYAAKEEGRNRYHLYHPDDEQLKRREMEMECVNQVHDALAHHRLELHAQRILGLAQNENHLMYFEVLVRMRDDQGELVPPGIFMPASERYNVAHLVDREVVAQALSWLSERPEVLEKLGLCSINLSGQSMGNKDFTRFLIESIDQSAVPSHKICLEITETAAIGNMNEAIKLFGKLKELGCLIALDDFGSGLSSFGYLKRLPVDIVKIDGLFVRDIDVDEMDHVMVRSINDLAKQMGKKTVAEFVENTAIVNKLLELGVDYGQGYLIGRPKPLPELVDELMEEINLADESVIYSPANGDNT